MLRGIQNAGTAFGLENGERKLVLQANDPPRSIAAHESKPSLHNSASNSARYSVVPEGLTGSTPSSHPALTNSAFVGVNSAQQPPFPGPTALTPLQFKTPGEELRSLLPPVKHVTKYCEIYHNSCHVLYPVDIGLPHMEELSLQYIHQSLGERFLAHYENRNMELFREEALKIALLCAGIAAGVQVSDLEELTRRSLLRQYVSSTMKLLRIADAQANSSIAAYPATLIVCRVVQDELEPILSYTLLGTLQRMAHIYATTSIFTDRFSEQTRHLRAPDNLVRVRLRQEAFLALILGQSNLLERPPFPDVRNWSNAGYTQCLDVLASISTYCGTENIDREELLVSHADALQSIQPLERWVTPHLADKANCRNVHELTEFCTLRLHECLVNVHYCQIIMAACRRLPGHEEEYFKTGDVCKQKARDCIGAYLEMLAFSVAPLRSWILTVTALRAALVLGVLLAEFSQNVTESAQDRERLSRLLQAFTNVQDETQADRSRWLRRYRNVFERLREMCELLAQPASRAMVMNGAASPPEQGTALRYMTRDDRDNIMMPQRMVQHYLASPCDEESPFKSLLLSQQSTFEI